MTMEDDLRTQLLEYDRFSPTPASKELLAHATEAIAEIDGHRPLREDTVRRLEAEILSDRVHSSAVTEGNRLSKRETIVVLTTGLIEAGSRKDELEVRNLAEAVLEVNRLLKDGLSLNHEVLRHLHALVLRDIDPTAGAFRAENVTIWGAKRQPPFFHDVLDLVRLVLDAGMSEDLQCLPVQRAAWLHWALTRIHPFKDGNGRAARLALDYILLKYRQVPAPLQPEDREGPYYSALEAADLGDGRPLLELVAKNMLAMADRYLAFIRDDEAKTSWLQGVTAAAKEKVTQSAHRRFLGVQRATNILKAEFFGIATQLDQELEMLDVNFRDYGNIEFEKFQELEKKGTAKRTWLFGLEFRLGESRLRYVFWYGVHHRRPDDIVTDLPTKVVVLVSAEEEANYYRSLDDLTDSARISLREIVPDGSLFMRRRHNPLLKQSEWDSDVTAGTIVRDFFQEVLGQLGLV
ncbi:MAG: Fic family protein [Thermoanaerobaculia bacterium]|nr:Fic family protein [Thermoanaerobaculia bacterium]